MTAEQKSDFDLTGDWLKRSGVPHYSRQKRNWGSISVCLSAIFLMSALQLAVLTQIPESVARTTLGEGLFQTSTGIDNITVVQAILVLSPAVFLTLSWLLRRPVRRVLGVPSQNKLNTIKAIQIVVGLAAVVAFAILVLSGVGHDQGKPWRDLLNPQLWLAFVVVLCAYFTALMLWNSRMWTAAGGPRRWALLILVLAAALLATGNLLGAKSIPLLSNRSINLLFTLVLLLVALFLARKFSKRQDGSRDHTFPDPTTKFVPAMPLVVVGVGIASAFDPGRSGDDYPLNLLVVCAIWALGIPAVLFITHHFEARTTAKTFEGLDFPTFWLLATMCLVPYPACALLKYGKTEFIFSGLVNALWIGVILLWIIYRLNRILTWALSEIRGRMSGIVLSLVWSLPILILFVVVIIFSDNIWQVATFVSAGKFWIAIGCLVLLILVILALAARREISARSKFGNPDQVFKAFAWDVVLEEERNPVRLAQLRSAIEHKYMMRHDRTMKLNHRETINAIVADVVFRLVVLSLTALVTMIAIFGLTCLLISPELATAWIEDLKGGQLVPPNADPLLARIRVAVLISMFGMLDMTVRVARGGGDGEKDKIHNGFDARADHALREQFAVRRIHHACAPDQTPQS